MPSVLRFDPAKISDKVEGRFPLRLVRLCLMEARRLLDAHESVLQTGGSGSSSGTGGGAGGGTGGGSTARRFVVRWVANGPYRVDSNVDGAWVVTEDCTIQTIYLWRGTAGTSGSTIIDLKRQAAGTSTTSSIYVTTANRPTLAYNDADGLTPCNLPDVVALTAGDAITTHCLAKDTGLPLDYVLTLEAA